MNDNNVILSKHQLRAEAGGIQYSGGSAETRDKETPRRGVGLNALLASSSLVRRLAFLAPIELFIGADVYPQPHQRVLKRYFLAPSVAAETEPYTNLER